MKQILRDLLPHLAALAIFLLLTVAYFSPVFFEGKTLQQSDMISVQGMGHDAKEYHEQTGEYAHWSNAMFGGMPHNVTYGVSSNNVFQYVSTVLKVGLPPYSAALIWLLLLGGYAFMLSIGAKPWLSVVGAAAFAFCSYNPIIIAAGHVTKALVLATIPALIGGVMLCYKGRYALGFAITLVATGLNIYWNHQQISYYTILMLVPLALSYAVYALIKKEHKPFWLASALLVLAAVLAALPAVDKLLPTLDYSKETMRGGAVLSTGSDIKAEKTGLERDYAFAWSYGREETLTLLMPNFMGGSSHYPLGQKSETYNTVKSYAGASTAKKFVGSVPTYWGDQPFTSGPVYAGAIICFLAALGLVVVRRRDRWWLLAAIILGIFLAWGRNFPLLNNFLFDHLPLYNKFRTPAMALVITTTAMFMLGMLALNEVVQKRVQASHILWAAGAMILICLPFALFPSIAGSFTGATDSQIPDWMLPSLIEDRRAMLRTDAWRSICFIAAAAAMLYAYLKTEKIKQIVPVAVVGLLIVIDLWTVDKHFLNNDNFVRKQEATILPTQNDLQILQDTDPDYRVLNLASNTFNESQTSYFHKSVGGYSPAKLRRYQDVIDRYFSGRLNMNVINMLNTRYLITRDGVRYNPEAYGNAWFVSNINWVNNPNEEIDAIATADLKAVAVVDTCWRQALAPSAQKDMQGTVEEEISGLDELIKAEPNSIILTKYANPGQIFYTSNSDNGGVAVFSEIYYKTWQAYIDGKRAPLARADYLLRAVYIPAGTHEIELRCVDELYLTTHRWSLIASVIACLALIAALVIGIKNSTEILNQK